jgi:hypothetical protein
MTRGITYICSGEEYVTEAINSAESVKKYGEKTAIITGHQNKDQAKSGPFDKVITKDMVGDIRDKVYNIEHSPWKKTVFLDTDTLVLGDISPLFDILDRVNIAIARSPSRIVTLGDVPDSFPEFNTGVIALNNDDGTVQNFLREWKEEYEKQLENGYPDAYFPVSPEADNMDDATPVGRKNDQPAFRKTLYLIDIPFSVLPREYNFRGMGASVYNQVKIVHHRRWIRYNKLTDNLNASPKYRCFWDGKLHREVGNDINVKPTSVRIKHATSRLLSVPVKNLPVGYVLKKIRIYEQAVSFWRWLKN